MSAYASLSGQLPNQTHLAERRRPEPPMRRVPCPHCGRTVPTERFGRHTADTGDAQERPEWACPVLFERRRGMHL